MSRVVALDTAQQQCVYASAGANHDVVGINGSTLTVGGSASGSETDGGTSNGIGLAMNSNYLYTSFSDSNTIGTFAVESGCGLTFIGDTSAKGLHGGIINGMAVHGTMLIASFTDGSIPSHSIFPAALRCPMATNRPPPHDDEARRAQPIPTPSTLPATATSPFFGDTSTAFSVGNFRHFFRQALQKRKSTNPGRQHQFWRPPSEDPDETMLYVVNTQGASVSALFFNSTTGTLSAGCTSPPLRGQSQDWSYLAGLTTINLMTATAAGASGRVRQRIWDRDRRASPRPTRNVLCRKFPARRRSIPTARGYSRVAHSRRGLSRAVFPE